MKEKETPIQIWEFRDYANRPARIEYCGEVLNVHYDFGAIPYPTSAILVQSYPLTDYITECLVLKYLVENHLFEQDKLHEKAARNWRFWKYLDLSKLPSFRYFPNPNYNHRTVLELSPLGIRGGYYKYNSEEIVFNNNYRLDNVFFDGPALNSMFLEDRKKLRQAIFDALDPTAGFSLKDAFPLFDYTKIATQEWKYTNENGFSGEFVVLHPDRFEIGGWDNPRDAGSSNYSIENIWAKRPNFVDASFGANDFIEKTLSAAIIKED